MSSYSTIQRRVSALKKSLLMHGGRLDPAELAQTHDSLVDLVDFTQRVHALHEDVETAPARARAIPDNQPELFHEPEPESESETEPEDPFAPADDVIG